jgi:hypothetical protein
LTAGIDVTHVDSHMGTIMNPLFIQSYLQAAAGRLIPPMLPRLDAQGAEMMGMGPTEMQTYAPIMQQLENIGMPMLDGILMMPLDEPSEQKQMEVARDLLGNLPVGITHFVFHPSLDTKELREKEDIKPIGYRQIRDAMRN